MKRYKLQFYGSVQGVGFRYTARHAANMYRLTGYVRNDYDGSVTCEVQGDPDAIDAFIRTLNQDCERVVKGRRPISRNLSVLSLLRFHS